MTEKEKDEYLAYLAGKGSIMGLASIKCLLSYFGNPEKDQKVIQIAGTNGKGSILSMLSSVLREAGYKVGAFSSPAVFEEREIIKCGKRNIAASDYLTYLQKMRETTEQMEADGQPCPTLFEVQTAMAYLYFKEKAMDVVIMETGLGGAEDATNVCAKNLAAVFATISLDHIGILGDSIEKITAVKAGIMKAGCAAIAGQQAKAALAVLRRMAKETGTVLKEPEFVPENIKCYKNKTMFSYGNYKKLIIPLLGAHQVKNAIAVLDTVDVLNGQGFHITEKALRQGLENAVWPGRLEIIKEKPLVILDGAHNEDAAKQLKEALLTLTGKQPLILLMGMFRDKEYEKVVSIMAPLGAQIITVSLPNQQRTLPAHQLADCVRKLNPNVTEAESIEEAVEIAKLLSGGICPIVAFGSLSHLGKIRACFLQKGKQFVP